MSAEDSVEIEFPSLARPPSAPEPLPVQDPGTDNNLAWLAAIFSDDDEPDFTESPESEASDAAPSVEPPPGPGDPDPIETTELAALMAGTFGAAEPFPEPDPGSNTPTHPSSDDPASRGDTRASVEEKDPRPAQTDPAEDPPPSSADGQGEDPPPTEASKPKKVTGFREEIISTFSQMYE